MTCPNNSLTTVLRRAAILFLPFGGKTPRGRGWSIWFPRYVLLHHGWSDCFRLISLPQGQVRVCQHHQSHMSMETGPQTSFIMVKTQLPFAILVESFNDPAHMCKIDQLLHGKVIELPHEVVFALVEVRRF